MSCGLAFCRIHGYGCVAYNCSWLSPLELVKLPCRPTFAIYGQDTNLLVSLKSRPDAC